MDNYFNFVVRDMVILKYNFNDFLKVVLFQRFGVTKQWYSDITEAVV